ncbi:MAG: type VI secretion system tip protein VgrG [Deltaproteobacteria bacterium]|nr:type VI secretion system tip protein VgrG [Deltaproteobacteria bacterium]
MTVRAFVYHDSLPPEDTVVARLHVREGLSQLFDIDVRFFATQPDLDLAAFIWSTVAFALVDDQTGSTRVFHGIVEEAEYLFQRQHRFVYRLRARPRVAGLAYRTRSRIHQSKNAVTIVKDVLRDAGIPDDGIDWTQLSGNVTYPDREYTTQWKESELAFVLRLLEDEGIAYLHEHSEVNHVLTFVDDPARYPPIEGQAVLSFTTERNAAREAVFDLVFTNRLVTNAHTTRDWDFMQPGGPLQAEQPGEFVPGTGSRAMRFEGYEYPGAFRDSTEGGRLAHNRLTESQVQEMTLQGGSNCIRLAPGRRVTVVDALPAYFVNDYLLLEVEHRFALPGGLETRGSASTGYTCQFKAIPSSTEYRPPRITPRPKIANKELAVVTTSGEEIEPDQWDRIHVHFYWDREGKMDDKASCWIRFQQQNTDGAFIVPRVGWEVSVGFLDGDPDRPVAFQKVYNLETMPPYGLPGAKTKTALQSSTSPGGAGTNEVRFEDGAGGQEMFVHASKDFYFKASNDHTEDVAVDATEDVGTTLDAFVGACEDITVTGDQNVSVTKATSTDTTGACTVHVGGTEDRGVKANYGLTTDASRTDHIQGIMNVLANSVTETFKADCTRTVGGIVSINSAAAISDNVGGSFTETVGAAKVIIAGAAYSEDVGAAKTLLSGAMFEKTGKDIGLTAKAAIAFTAASIEEECGGDFNVGAKTVLIGTNSLTFKCGGSEMKASGGTLTMKGGTLGGSGGPNLKLKGPINFKP